MHLLQVGADGEFSLAVFYGKQIPQYAILSHTWIADHEEVTFKDIMKGKGKSKIGYQKLHFIAKQAATDGLKYFWVDTCCIDKASSAELQESINSMFRWYQKAMNCYVYLSDVSSITPSSGAGGSSSSFGQPWRLAFLQSKWFTRGWTLQELLAPQSVQFFSAEGSLLGDKQSLWPDIELVTKIPHDVLQGSYAYLLKYDVAKRLSWAAERKTTREEDAAYSLLGLFDLHMPLLYGEGRSKAFMRLHRERESVPNYEQFHLSGAEQAQADPPSASNRAIEAGVQETPQQALLKRTADEAFGNSDVTEKRSMALLPPPYGPDHEMAEAHNLEIVEAPARVPRAVHNPLSNKVVHADIRIQSIEDWERPMEDITSSPAVVPEETSMKMWWNDSIARHLNTPDDYTQVAVLLIRWSDELDDLRTQDEVQVVEALFRERFRFRTEILELNIASKPQLQLNHRISSFIVENDGPNNLLIVYYTGHSVYQDLEHYLQLSACRDPDHGMGFLKDAHANWNKAEDILRSEDTDADVLIILDATYTDSVIHDRPKTSYTASGIGKLDQTKRIELMSACTIEESRPPPGSLSFTRVFVDTLKGLLAKHGDEGISTLRLNQEICMDARRHATPSQLYTMLRNDQHILLKPLKPAHVQRYEMFRARVGGRLTLSFDLRDKNLTQEQIEYFARGLGQVFRDKQNIGLRKIGWQGMVPVQQSPGERLALAKSASNKWKAFVRKRREMRVNDRLMEYAALPIE